jgi:hypothetical protein
MATIGLSAAIATVSGKNYSRYAVWIAGLGLGVSPPIGYSIQ